MINTISKIKRIDDARQARSDALNRRLIDDQEAINALKGEIRLYQWFGVLLALIFASAALGIK